MAKFLFLICCWVFLISPSQSLTCNSQTFTKNALYAHCLDLPTLSSYLHFTYDSSNTTLSVAFIAAAPNSGGWVAWAINPTGTGMIGSQSLVAYKQNGKMSAKLYNVSSYSSIVETQKLAFDVWDLSAEEIGGSFRIFAKIKVPADLAAKKSVNHVWQVGPGVSDGGMLAKHAFQQANLKALGTLDLLSGGVIPTSGNGADSKLRKKNIHGILNTVSWGLLFPLGVVIARYVRTFKSADPAWFYAHVTCQLSAYILGVAGWGTGLKLGSESKGIQYNGHRNIGISLFCLATVQIFALFLRPNKDHKFRLYWNIYHHGVGYAVIILGIINVFKGFDILRPEEKWKSAYIIVIAILGGIAVFLEAVTWIIVWRRKSDKSTKPYDGHNTGDSRQQPLTI